MAPKQTGPMTESDGLQQPARGLLMDRLVRWLTAVPPRLGRTLPVRVVLFVGCAYLFLWVPDLDFALLGLLHHRSILTHSLLPGLLLIALGRGLGAAPLSGALIGLSVHLGADMLSPMVGFAQIWLPWPWLTPLGQLSYLWLFVNAVLGFALASFIARLVFPRWLALPMVFLLGAVTGVSYGVLNEGAVVSAFIVLMLLTVSLLPETLWRRRMSKVVQRTD